MIYCREGSRGMRLPFSAAIDDTVGVFVWCVWAMHLLETC